MKTGKLAIRPWLSSPYNKHTLVDLPSSVSFLNSPKKQKKLTILSKENAQDSEFGSFGLRFTDL